MVAVAHLPHGALVAHEVCHVLVRVAEYVEDLDGAVGRARGESLAVVVELSVVYHVCMRRVEYERHGVVSRRGKHNSKWCVPTGLVACTQAVRSSKGCG
jgi:hypothetical protein